MILGVGRRCSASCSATSFVVRFIFSVLFSFVGVLIGGVGRGTEYPPFVENPVDACLMLDNKVGVVRVVALAVYAAGQ